MQAFRPKAPAASSSLQSELRAAVSLLRRRYRQILLGTLIGAVLLAVYSFTATPIYKATTQISLDPRSLSVLDTTSERSQRTDAPVADSARVDSLVEVLQSTSIVSAVIKRLALQDDPEFNGKKATFISSIIGPIVRLFSSAEPLSENDRIIETIDVISKRLTVDRPTGTYIVTLGFQSESPEKAAQIANMFAEAYFKSQLNADFAVTRAASDWLKDRASELRAQMLQTEATVAEYKSAHGIATSDGKSIADIMLADISTKVTEAAHLTAEKKAKLDRIVQVNANDKLDLSVADALTNDVIIDLRKKYFDALNKANNLAQQYGENHEAVKRYRSESNTILASIRDELKRMEETSRSEYAIAQQRETAARDSMSNQFLKTIDVGKDQVRLQQLESAAATSQLAYEDTLKRYTETVQKESFPVIQARVITPAVPPTEKFKPKKVILIPVGAAVGTLLGFAFVVVAELFDRRIRSKTQAENAVGAECLGTFPFLAKRAVPRPQTFERTGRATQTGELPWDYAVQEPFSAGAEALRSIKVAVDQSAVGSGCQIVGIVSSLPGEGKSTVAANLAHLIGDSGRRVMLIDADIRRSALSHRMFKTASSGLPDVLLAGADYRSLVVSEPALNLDFLPAVTKLRVSHSHELLGSKAMEDLLQQLSATYDYVIIDLPPIMPIVDARTIAPLVHAFLFVVAWGETLEDVTTAALDSAQGVREKLIGVVLNKVRINQLKRYGEYSASYYSETYHNA